ncbi:MAG: hypothetical protein HQK91_13240 [Nitrospirae bacterium]|nr:hypothetical protein [Nitrospirota bacterium]MBF0542401.1 hypothetical protein [Nitrospirota bacterium]
MRNIIAVLIIMSFVILIPCNRCGSSKQCDAEQEKQTKFVYNKDKNIIKTHPLKPVKIKLKRDYDGDYSWEIVGEDAGDVLRNNRMLEEKLKKE